MYVFHGDKRIQIYHVLTPLSTLFSYIVAGSFIGGENRSTRRKQHTFRKSLTNFIT